MEETNKSNRTEESSKPNRPSAPEETTLPDLPPLYEPIVSLIQPTIPPEPIIKQPLRSRRYLSEELSLEAKSQHIAKTEFPARSEFIAVPEILPTPEVIKTAAPIHNDQEIKPTPLPIKMDNKGSSSSEPFPEAIEVKVRENKSLLDAARAAKPPHLQANKKIAASRTESNRPTTPLPNQKVGGLSEILPSRKDSDIIKPVSQTNSCTSLASFEDAESDSDYPLSNESSTDKLNQAEKTDLEIDIIGDSAKRANEAEDTVLFGFLGKTKVIPKPTFNVNKDLDEIQSDIDAMPLTDRQTKKRFVKKYGVPSALEVLEHIDMLFLERVDKTKINMTFKQADSIFAFKDRTGEVLFYAIEAARCWPAQYCASSRPFIMKIYDKGGEEVINFTRKMSCVASCILPCMWQSIRTYSPPNVLIGTVEEDFTLCIPKYTVYSSSGASIVTLRGPIGASIFNNNIEFLIYQRDSLNDIGLISERWPVDNNNIYRQNVFGIQFPIDLNVKVKILLMSAATLINYIYYRMPALSDSESNTNPVQTAPNRKQFGAAEEKPSCII